ncbi:MAG: hypothetical protein EZS28_006041 [Streblomastix strix]|uniref:Uncharacterized protein n=1 Tax=Streblomastix strix TaxID=222440 RepID=A0A5J4WV45_9EUKA|nr:MAG: hypothetical protein EZS28_006041 [Streblomastix strix]
MDKPTHKRQPKKTNTKTIKLSKNVALCLDNNLQGTHCAEIIEQALQISEIPFYYYNLPLPNVAIWVQTRFIQQIGENGELFTEIKLNRSKQINQNLNFIPTVNIEPVLIVFADANSLLKNQFTNEEIMKQQGNNQIYSLEQWFSLIKELADIINQQKTNDDESSTENDGENVTNEDEEQGNISENEEEVQSPIQTDLNHRNQIPVPLLAWGCPIPETRHPLQINPMQSSSSQSSPSQFQSNSLHSSQIPISIVCESLRAVERRLAFQGQSNNNAFLGVRTHTVTWLEVRNCCVFQYALAGQLGDFITSMAHSVKTRLSKRQKVVFVKPLRKTATEKSEIWRRMLQEIDVVTPNMATGIVKEYPSFCQLIANINQSQFLTVSFADLFTGIVTGKNQKKMNSNVSSRVANIFTTMDPNAPL